MSPRDDFVHYALSGVLPNPMRHWGPHHYRLAVNGHPDVPERSGIPAGTVFRANGYSHVLRSDLSLATMQHYKVITGVDFEASMVPVQVE